MLRYAKRHTFLLRLRIGLNTRNYIMIKLWIILSVLAAAIWAVNNVVDKFVISKLVANPIIPTAISSLVGLLVGLGVLAFHGFGNLSFAGILTALVAGSIYIFMAFLYYHALKVGEVSTLIPLFFLAPLFIALIAGIFLGEIFTPAKYAGVIMLTAGAFLISWEKSATFRFGKGFWLMILAAFLLSVNQVMTKYLLNMSDFWTVFAYVRIGSFLPVIPALIMNFSELKRLFKDSKKTVALVVSSESLYNVAVALITLAIAIGPVTLVNALSSVQPFFLLLFVVLLSVFYPHILKEDVAKPRIALKLLATTIMFAGALLLS